MATKTFLERAEKAGKFLLKWGLIGLILALVLFMVGESPFGYKGTVAYAPPSRAQEINWPIPNAERAKGFPRKYIKVVDLSDMTENSPPQVIPIPSKASGEYVSVILPTTYYVIKKFPSVDVRYDYGAGYSEVIDGPGKIIPTKNAPPAFDMQGVGESGVLTIRCYRKPTGWDNRKNVSTLH